MDLLSNNQSSDDRGYVDANRVKSISNNSSSNKDKKSDAIQIPSITLPKGGGAIKSIDEKFQINAVNGTSSFQFLCQFRRQ